MTETINQRRRRMLAATAMTIAAVDFPRAGAADAPPGGAKSSFAPLKQVAIRDDNLAWECIM